MTASVMKHESLDVCSTPVYVCTPVCGGELGPHSLFDCVSGGAKCSVLRLVETRVLSAHRGESFRRCSMRRGVAAVAVVLGYIENVSIAVLGYKHAFCINGATMHTN